MRETIRADIAREKARAQIEDTLAKLTVIMNRYKSQRVLYETKKNDPNQRSPEPLNFAELAKAHGLEAHKTKPVSAEDVRSSDLGNSYRVVVDQRFGARVIYFPELAYNESVQLYDAGESTRDNANNYYLWWKIKDVPEYVPELAEIRSQVMRQLKMVEARKLALAQARKYADAARRSKGSLEKSPPPNLKVGKADPFTWLTTGSTPLDPQSGVPRITDVEGIEGESEEFMQTVFGLTEGKLGVAQNRAQTIVYIVRLLKSEPPVDELYSDFAAADFRRYQAVAQSDRFEMYRAWIADVEKEAGVRWLREPSSETSRS